MKLILLLLIVAISSTAQAETVKKWIDEQGRIHYGNSNAASDAETVEIMDTFDEKAYQEGVQRYEEMETFEQEQLRKRKMGGGHGYKTPPRYQLPPPAYLPPPAPTAPSAPTAPPASPGPVPTAPPGPAM